MKHKIIRALTENLWLKIIALLIAFLIWVFVTNNDDPIRSIVIANVPITIVNEESIADIGKVVEPEGSGTANLKVTERRSVLSRLSRNNFYIEADLENINQMDSVPLTVSCDNSAVTWDEIAISPVSLKVTIEDKVEQAFAVTVAPSGEPASGYALGKTEVEGGKNILIAGPESLVKIINQVTAPVNIAGRSEDTTLTSSLRVFDRNGAELTEAQMGRLEFKTSEGEVLADHVVTVKIYMWKVLTDVPIMVQITGAPAWGYKVEDVQTIPASVNLAGTDEALSELGSLLVIEDAVDISGAVDDMSLEIDLNETLARYESLKLVGDIDPMISVTVIIEPSSDVTVEIPLSDVQLIHKPEKMKLVYTPADQILAGVHSLNDEPVQISAQNIRARIDLEVCKDPGTYDIPVEIELPEGYELSGEVTIRVNSIDPDTSDAETTTQSEEEEIQTE